MSQHDMVLENAAGLAFRDDLNAALAALVTLNSGDINPTTSYAGMLWLDTTVEPDGALRMRSLSNVNWLGALPLAEAPVILSGADTGTVMTTGNIASNASDAATTIFPIGSNVLASNTGANSRTFPLVVRLHATVSQYECTTGAGAALAGTWRTRGRVTVGAAYFYLMQRTA